MTNTFIVGQRWISDTESDLGLGTIIEEEFRHITVLFLATGDTRIYAKETAPLTRVQFSAGDNVSSHNDWSLSIESVEDEGGVLTYVGTRDDTGERARLPESDLNNFLQFRSPRDRLFAGLLDGYRWFALRKQVFDHKHALALSPIRGLQGARISQLQHQLYVAIEATRRLHPRVLLADEVGLGKTIEAGLILHRQIVNQQVSRVLIMMPPALLHQWLVEMLRKFNLKFSIMDGERFAELAPSAPDGNPFLSEQLVLCSTDTLLEDEVMSDAAIAAGWDMLVVDEAHHLSWEPDNPSFSYQLVEELAAIVPSVLLLTATPEQLGQAGHFARLRLLDPARFSDLESYIKEEQSFAWVAQTAQSLHEDKALDAEQIAQLEQLLDEPFSDSDKTTLSSDAALSVSELGGTLIDKLIDRHGTGRLLFRNTRSAITGFPSRKLHQYTIEDELPETKAIWLIEFLAEHYPEKVLLICSDMQTVQDLAEALRKLGVSTAQFHEEMSIVERDRAAAYFADPEDDCRLLLCSEIGSEGRNFQFLHHLVTFELPLSPDLLEQRIGRLDRIGQTQDIQIHVPSEKGSLDELLTRWYHEGLNAFESICKAGTAVTRQVAKQLHSAVLHAESSDDPFPAMDALISDTKAAALTVNEQLENGRDRLLELNSNRPDRIQVELDALARSERDYRIQDFMSAVFDRFGVNVEDQSDSWILHPSDNMHIETFPYLPASGLTVTFDRTTALTREDYTFLTWDHPMVMASMDMILNEGYGQADCRVVTLPELPKGLALVEATYTMGCTADAKLNVERYLKANLQTYYVGIDKKDYTEIVEQLDLDSAGVRYDRNKLKGVVQKHRELLDSVIDITVEIAEKEIPEYVAQAKESIEADFGEEHERLTALQKVNPSVSSQELDALIQRRDELLAALGGAQARPVSVRVLFNN
jgi:ATP-dependent helicase HepA